MREIKFRVWDKEAQRMIIDCPVSIAGIVRHKMRKTCDPNGNLLAEKYVLMQYTGSNDKNGKEVYEGDIIKYEFDDEKKIDVVVFEPSIFTTQKTIRWDFDEDEVIGNIYENPELIE